MRKSGWAAVAATIALVANAAQAAEQPKSCLTRPEITAVVVAVLPDILDGVSKKCMTVLPETATLRGGLAPLLDHLRPASEAAWPLAAVALGKVGGDEFKGMDPKLVRPLVGPMLASMASEKIKPETCPMIDRVVTDLAPLPASNIADLAVVLVEVGQEGGKKSEFAVCPTEAKATASL